MLLRGARVRAQIISAAQGREWFMPIDPDDLGPRIKTPEFALGQDLSAMSEHELAARIAAMEAEIARCREAITARRATRDAASVFFKRS
jgi:uncharacterized small protein (DUF1192 family)